MRYKIVNIGASIVLAVLVIAGIYVCVDGRMEKEPESSSETGIVLQVPDAGEPSGTESDLPETSGETESSKKPDADARQDTTKKQVIVSANPTEPATTDTTLYQVVEYVDATNQVSAKFEKQLAAKSAILVDVNQKAILYEKNSDVQMDPASTTKLLTALVALEYWKADETITVGSEINLVAPDASRAWLEAGDKLTVEQMIQGMLICSGNDAAYVLAANTGRRLSEKKLSDSEAVRYFIDLMNQRVKEMQLSHTHFNSPDGYDADNQYTSAEDLAVIAYQAYQNPVIRRTCKLSKVYVPERDVTWQSTNQLLNPDSEYYYDKAIGMKTGSTDNAGKCLVSLAKEGEQVYLCVVLNSDEPGRWTDSISLFDYGFSLKK